MGLETPHTPSPEEMAEIEKERALSDAELLKEGAEFKFDEKGEKRLEVTDEQIEETRREMEKLLSERDKIENEKIESVENKEVPEKLFKMTRVINGVVEGITEFEYDEQGRKAKEVEKSPKGNVEKTIEYQYDVRGTLIKERIVRGDSHRKIEYDYDKDKLVSKSSEEFWQGMKQEEEERYNEKGDIIFTSSKEFTANEMWGGWKQPVYKNTEYKNKYDDQGRLVESLGEMKGNYTIGVEKNSYNYSSKENVNEVKKRKIKIIKHIAGSFASNQEYTSVNDSLKQFDQEGKIKLSVEIGERGALGGKNEKYENVKGFLYNKSGDIARVMEVLRVEGKEDEKIETVFNLEYGSVIGKDNKEKVESAKEKTKKGIESN